VFCIRFSNESGFTTRFVLPIFTRPNRQWRAHEIKDPCQASAPSMVDYLWNAARQEMEPTRQDKMPSFWRHRSMGSHSTSGARAACKRFSILCAVTGSADVEHGPRQISERQERLRTNVHPHHTTSNWHTATLRGSVHPSARRRVTSNEAVLLCSQVPKPRTSW